MSWLPRPIPAEYHADGCQCGRHDRPACQSDCYGLAQAARELGISGVSMCDACEAGLIEAARELGIDL